MQLRKFIRGRLFPAGAVSRGDFTAQRDETMAAIARVSAELGNLRDELHQLRDKLNDFDLLRRSYDLVMRVAPATWPEIYPYLRHSKAQNLQDILVLAATRMKRRGFFVEFGATNGVDLSNTHLLEKHFGWTGILAEPAKVWWEDLQHNRDCFIDNACVWAESGKQATFRQTEIAELSTLSEFRQHDFNADARMDGLEYQVQTISLNDLLAKYGAPKLIDFLSVDTEGSELDIFKAFDFGSYRFKIVICEHNYTPQREEIFDLLTSNGYERTLEDIAGWDDWYVLKE